MRKIEKYIGGGIDIYIYTYPKLHPQRTHPLMVYTIGHHTHRRRERPRVGGPRERTECIHIFTYTHIYICTYIKPTYYPVEGEKEIYIYILPYL